MVLFNIFDCHYYFRHGSTDPLTEDVLQIAHLKPDLNTKKAAKEYRMSQIKETPV